MSQSFDDSNTIKQIKEAFPQLSNDEKIKAFSQLAQMQGKGTEGASAIMDLLRLYANSGTLPQSIIWSLGTVREHADIYFPELLNYAEIPMLGHRIYALCALYISSKWLPPDKLESHFDLMMTYYQSLKNQSSQKDNHADKYYQIYSLLEILAYFPTPEVETELYNALDFYSEVGLKYQAISSLWRLGKHVDHKYILDLITDDAMRWSMFWRLQERGELSLFPEQYRTAEAFARATLVSMFQDMYATKLDNFEFVEVIPIGSKITDNSGDYYIYRVFTDFGQGYEKYWVAAWAGPVPQEFNFLNLKMPHSIFSRTGISDDYWGSRAPKELILDIYDGSIKIKTNRISR